MIRIRWTRVAAVDLEQIGNYFKEHNPRVARATVTKLYDAAVSLRRFPIADAPAVKPGLANW